MTTFAGKLHWIFGTFSNLKQSAHFYRLTASIILDLTYGYQIKEDRDTLIELVEDVMGEFGRHFTPGAHLVDTFTWRMER